MSGNTVRQVAFRLKSDGKAEVQRDLGDIKTSGVATYDAIGAAQDRANAAADRAIRRNQALAASGREAYAAWTQQQKFNAVLGVDRGPSASARESAAVFEAEAQAMDLAQSKAALLRAQIDPLGTAQSRLNTELSEYSALAKRGVISTQELAAAEALARKRFDETTAAIGRQGGSLTRLEKASRLNLTRQGADVAVTAAMGMNPAMIAIQQGPQILDALATSGIKASGALLGVSAAALVVGGALVGGIVINEKYARSIDALAITTDGLGRRANLSAAEMAAMAEEAGKAGEISTAAAREQAQAFLSTGVVGAEVLDRLIAQGRDYQVTFGEDAVASTKRLADAMADPAQAARTWASEKLGVDQATVRLIETLQREHDLIGAQMVLLDAAGPKLSKHADYVTQMESAWDSVSRKISNATDALGKFLYTSDEEKIQKAEDRQDLAKRMPWLFNQDRIKAEADEIAKYKAEQAARKKRLADNAAAVTRSRAEAADRSAYDRVFPEDARIAQLRADKSVFDRDAADPKKSEADRTRAREASAAAVRDMAALEKKKDGVTRSSGRHAAALGRETDSLEANAKGTLSAAEAYLTSSEEGLKADAKRTAATRAARNGADEELRTRQQLALMIAEQASAGAKAVAEMKAEEAARKRVNDAVAAGTMSIEDANRALQLESQTRPLTIAMTLAEGEAKETLKRVIDQLTTSYGNLNAERAREAILQNTDSTKRSIALLETELRLVRATDEERAVAIARQQTQQELDAKKIGVDSPEGKDALAKAEEEARKRSQLSRAQYGADQVRDQKDALILAEAEMQLLKTRPGYRDQEIERLRLILDLKRQGIDAESAEGKEILANHDHLTKVQQQLERARSSWDIIEQAGSGALDRFGDLVAKGEDDWDVWKNTALDAIQEVIAEMIKLWLINPMKNALFGQNNPTGADAGGIFGGFFNGMFGGGQQSAESSGFSLSGVYARGTESAKGGLALYGEHGPEIGFVPAGTKIKSHTSSMDMLREALGGSRGDSIQVDLGGFSIDARGADMAAAERMERSVEQLRRDVGPIAVAAVQDAMRRRQIR